jgi:N-formylglutamate amidohydrolase
MLAVGVGAVYTRTSQKKPLRDETIFHPGSPAWTQLIHDYFTPYTRALQQLVNERLDACGEVTIIDVHSFRSQALPYELHAEFSRPEICIGSGDFHTPDHLKYQMVEAFTDFGTVGVNEPFIGTYVPLEQCGTDRRLRSVVIEIRRDIYMDEVTGESEDDVIAVLGVSLASLL